MESAKEPANPHRARSVREKSLGSLALVAVLLLAGCRSPTIQPRWTLTNSLALRVDGVARSAATKVLDPVDRDLAGLERLRREVEDSGKATAEQLLEVAELSLEVARGQGGGFSGDAAHWYRDAAAYAAFSLSEPPEFPGSITHAQAAEVHNQAITDLLRLLGAREGADPSWRVALAMVGIELIEPSIGSIPPGSDEICLTTDYRVKNVRPMVRAGGLGVPLIRIHHFPNREATPDRFYPIELRLPSTAVLVPKGPREFGAWRHQPARLELHDSLVENSIQLGASSYELAYDLTTPLAHQFLESPLEQVSWAGLLRPDRLDEITGIYLSGPYEAGKIPVVFVHGLWSSPMTWMSAFNSLRADPVMRRRFQFWFALYPTGSGVLGSVAKLRQDLERIREAFDPARTDPSFDQMVLIGHSLGGVVSKALAEDSEGKLESALLSVPLDQLRLTPETRALAERMLRFQAVPSVRRVIFIAAPHRGSRRANQLVGRLATRLIQPDDRAAALFEEVSTLNAPEVLAPFYRGRPRSTVDNLEPRSPVLRALADLPMAAGVESHSIIGVLHPRWPERFRGDLVVPYTSAHLDGTSSEVLVRRSHFCTAAPEVIAELDRLLRLHAGLPRGLPCFPGQRWNAD